MLSPIIIPNLILYQLHLSDSIVRPHFTFNDKEQGIIDAEIEKFLLQGIIRASVSEPGEIMSPIFITPKKDCSSRVIFNLKGLNEIVSYHHF